MHLSVYISKLIRIEVLFPQIIPDKASQVLEIVADWHSYRLALVIFLVKQNFRQIRYLLYCHFIFIDIEKSKSNVFVDQQRSYLFVLFVKCLYSHICTSQLLQPISTAEKRIILWFGHADITSFMLSATSF